MKQIFTKITLFLLLIIFSTSFAQSSPVKSNEVNSDGNGATLTNGKQIVTDYHLYQNYPNPFNPQTRITYSLKAKGLVQLNVYNILGQLVCKLVNASQEAGTYSVTFDGTNLISGIYVYELKVLSPSDYTNNFTASRKLILIK
ncbi:MAG: T9SS type A sorting domain-containing protein [Ignavibacteriaceae bacterium]|nr:T9SS type A sorting domain-containing protein [Ignavibacteriaceae bacterium]